MTSALSNDPRRQQPRSVAALWAGIIGPPVIWLLQFQVKYAVAAFGHGSRLGVVSLATSVCAAAVITLLGYVAARERRLATASPLDASAGVAARNRFMATLGLLTAALFLLVVVAQLLADFFVTPGTA